MYVYEYVKSTLHEHYEAKENGKYRWVHNVSQASVSTEKGPPPLAISKRDITSTA